MVVGKIKEPSRSPGLSVNSRTMRFAKLSKEKVLRGDQPGEGANLVVNNGNTSNAKGTSHQISHLEEDISNQGKVPQVNFCKQAYKCIDNKGTVPIAKVRVRPQPRKKNPDVNAASSEGPLNTVAKVNVSHKLALKSEHSLTFFCAKLRHPEIIATMRLFAQGQVSSGTANAPEKRKAAPTLPQ